MLLKAYLTRWRQTIGVTTREAGSDSNTYRVEAGCKCDPTTQESPPQYRVIWSRMSIVPLLRIMA